MESHNLKSVIDSTKRTSLWIVKRQIKQMILLLGTTMSASIITVHTYGTNNNQVSTNLTQIVD